MRRLSGNRFMRMLVVATVGTTPFVGTLGGCLNTHDLRQSFWETALADPWEATPGSTSYPSSYIAGVISRTVNPSNDPVNNPNSPGNLDLQRILNTAFASIATFINSQIDVYNPYGWADIGRPR